MKRLLLLLALAGVVHAEEPELSIVGALPSQLRAEKTKLTDARERASSARQRVVILTGQYEELAQERQANARVQQKLEADIDELRTRLMAVQTELARLATELENTNVQFTQAFSDFSRRLVSLYEMRSYPLVGFVFRAQSFTEFLRRAEYARVLSAADLKKMEELTALRGQMDSKSKALEAEKQKMEGLKEEKKKKNQSLAQAITKGQEILDKLRLERVSALNRASSLEKHSHELEDKIRQLERQRVADLAKPGQAEQEPVAAGAGPVSLERNLRPGSLGWPLDGDMEVLRPFGKVKSANEPDYNNPGIDVRIVGLKTVKAVEAGKVIHHGRLPSFGKVLMIDHGGKSDKIISVYGNLDSIMVNVGQWVRRGDPVALIGQGSGQPGAETQLHLEIRKNAEPSDPLAWLER